MKQVKQFDLYTYHLLKLYYKLYRNRLPPYFNNYLTEYGDYTHNLRKDLIRLPAIRCELGAMNECQVSNAFDFEVTGTSKSQ